MVEVIENLMTLETGGQAIWRNVEGSSGAAVSLVSTPAPPHPTFENYCLKIPSGVGNWLGPKITTTGVMTLGIYFQFDGVKPVGDVLQRAITIRTASGTPDWSFQLQWIASSQTFKWQMSPAGGTAQDIGDDIIDKDTWYLLQFQWLQGNSAAWRMDLNKVGENSSNIASFTGLDLMGRCVGYVERLLDCGTGGSVFFF